MGAEQPFYSSFADLSRTGRSADLVLIVRSDKYADPILTDEIQD